MEYAAVFSTEALFNHYFYSFIYLFQAIHGFRETERSKWGKASSKILARLQEYAFPNQGEKLALMHILDLAKTGVIKPHVDSIRVRKCHRFSSPECRDKRLM